MPSIDLGYSTGVGVILKSDAGIYYLNQTGGIACLQSIQQGFYVPINGEAENKEEELSGFFGGPKWKGACHNGIDEDTAHFIDKVLSKSIGSAMFRVDRSKLKESHEAWIHVQVDFGRDVDGILDGFKQLGIETGIMTWMNSD